MKNGRTLEQGILYALSRQAFADWYNEGGKFNTWLTEGISSKLREEDLINDIRRLFLVDSRRTCRQCKGEFQPNNELQEVCSRECWDKFYE